MKTTTISLFYLLFLVSGFAQTPRFVTPIEGVYGQDFIITNYVDWQFQGISDHKCGTKTYDGHQGTDFVIKSFAQMDSGVAVLAVDTGLVIAVVDGIFDRETVSDTTKGLGNYIGLKHSGDLFTYYAHLKINSPLVQLGDTVLPGQQIAEVASSGNSSDPHLHFELWYDSLLVIDPYAGECGNTGTYWLDPIPYDDSYQLWESGLTPIVPTLEQLKERPEQKTEFLIGVDSVISFWTLQYGLLDGAVSKIQWFTPSNVLWSEWSLPYDQDWWYHYFWSYIDMPPTGFEGTWKVVYRVNGKVESAVNFEVASALGVSEKSDDSVALYYSDGFVHVNLTKSTRSNCTIEVNDMQGKKLFSRELADRNQSSIHLENLRSGTYIASLVEKGVVRKTLKFFVF